MAGRRALASAFSTLLALVGASAAIAGPGGISPPSPATPSGDAINQVYWVVFAICAAVFVFVEATLVIFVFRFRRRRETLADAEGPQIHGNTRLEVIWTIIPAVMLLGIALFTFARVSAVQATPDGGGAANALRVRVAAHQFYWQYEYPNGVVSLDTLRLPVDRPVRLDLVAYDVDHSWWVPELTGKKDAIPGQKNVLDFKPDRIGTFEGQCAELCGIQHALMRTEVQVLEQREFDAWLSDQASTQEAGGTALGRNEWEAVCAKCHGLAGEGAIGPAIAGNSILRNRQALIGLLSQGQDTPALEGFMPPVGLGWKGSQYDALVAYVKSNSKLSTAPGG
jgi:cytochrome c oxidase subunit II